MFDFEELRDLAADVRTFVGSSEDEGRALRDVIAAYDVVIGIFPLVGDDMGVHIVKGQEILDKIRVSGVSSHHTLTAIQVPNFRQAEQLCHLIERPNERKAA